MQKKTLTIPKFPDFVEIMGDVWKIKVMKNSDEPRFVKERCDGLCCFNEKLIIVADTRSIKTYENENQDFHNDYMKEILRHEIVHAFFFESGLGSSSSVYGSAWAQNEEMVDWFANQGKKIYRAWEQCGCLRVMPPERYLDYKTYTTDNLKKKGSSK